MRASLFLFLAAIIVGVYFWVTWSGVFLFLGLGALLVFIVITIGYPDTFLLFLLGARELRSSDEKIFFGAASQEAYKLAVPMPRLYFYDGSLERAFVFQRGPFISLVLNRSLLENSSRDELNAISFQLLLQVRKGMASKRTKCTFIIGFLIWIYRSILEVFLRLIPIRNLRKPTEFFLNYLLAPVLDLLFKVTMGKNYFKKLEQYLSEFPDEKTVLRNVGLKLRKPHSYDSLPSRKMMELQAVIKNKHFQNILALEFLPHEWDYLFRVSEISIAN
jgi:hypothetical protein